MYWTDNLHATKPQLHGAVVPFWFWSQRWYLGAEVHINKLHANWEHNVQLVFCMPVVTCVCRHTLHVFIRFCTYRYIVCCVYYIHAYVSTLLSAINDLHYDHSYSLQVQSSCTSALSIGCHETFWLGSAMPEGPLLHSVWRNHSTPHREQSLIQKWLQWWRTGRNVQSEGKAQMLQSTARLQNEQGQGMTFIWLLYIIADMLNIKHQCSIWSDLHEKWNIW